MFEIFIMVYFGVTCITNCRPLALFLPSSTAHLIALVPPRGVSSPHCSSPSTQKVAPQWTLSESPEVCGIHHRSHWSDPGQWWVCIQTGRRTADPLVCSQPPGAEPAQNYEDDSGLQDKPHDTTAVQHPQQNSVYYGHLQDLKSTISPDLNWPPTEECMAEVILQMTAQEV